MKRDLESAVRTFMVRQMSAIFSVHLSFNPFKPEFTIVIFVHYTPRIAVTILDL